MNLKRRQDSKNSKKQKLETPKIVEKPKIVKILSKIETPTIKTSEEFQKDPKLQEILMNLMNSKKKINQKESNLNKDKEKEKFDNIVKRIKEHIETHKFWMKHFKVKLSKLLPKDYSLPKDCTKQDLKKFLSKRWRLLKTFQTNGHSMIWHIIQCCLSEKSQEESKEEQLSKIKEKFENNDF